MTGRLQKQSLQYRCVIPEAERVEPPSNQSQVEVVRLLHSTFWTYLLLPQYCLPLPPEKKLKCSLLLWLTPPHSLYGYISLFLHSGYWGSQEKVFGFNKELRFFLLTSLGPEDIHARLDKPS